MSLTPKVRKRLYLLRVKLGLPGVVDSPQVSKYLYSLFKNKKSHNFRRGRKPPTGPGAVGGTPNPIPDHQSP